MIVYVGYDSREDLAYQVCEYSIKKNSPNCKVIPLDLRDLKEKKLYYRGEDKLGSTEFTFSRFLVPVLNDYQGWALFCDCDLLFLKPVEELFALADDKYAIMCAQHDYTPKEGVKMDGRIQSNYPRKNWSSVVLWNCAHPSNKKITVDLINDENTTGKYLHRFSWLEDNEIGKISHEWNWLVDWYDEEKDGNPNAIHYTEGGPWFKNYRFCTYHHEWKNFLFEMMNNKLNF